MNCRVCGNALGDLVRCSVCGFYDPGFVGDDPESIALIEKTVNEYRNKKWVQGSVSLQIYSHAVKDDKIVSTKDEEILLGEMDKLQDGQIQWYDEQFARQTGDCSLKIVIRKPNQSPRTMRITVPNPRIQEYWQVGLKRIDGSNCSLVVGTPVVYAESISIRV